MSTQGVFPVFNPKQLCAICQRLTLANPVKFNFIGELEFLPHHETIDSFYTALEEKCCLCTPMRKLMHPRDKQLLVERESRTWVDKAQHRVESKLFKEQQLQEKSITRFRIGVADSSKPNLWIEFEVNANYICFIAYRSQGIYYYRNSNVC
jgi:hypothetical protein